MTKNDHTLGSSTRAALLISCGAALLFNAACSCKNGDADESAAAMVGQLRSDLHPLESKPAAGITPAQQAYLDYYRIRVDPANYHFASFQSGGETLAAQFYRPANSARRAARGTVVIVHGYLDHAGSMANLINTLAADGYHLAIYDQPGHGLSTGNPVSAANFAVYENALSGFLDLVQKDCPPPYDIVGHSMGSTVVADHLLKYPDTPLRRVVLVAPLVRDGIPRPLRRFGIALSPMVEYMPRIPANNSSDTELAPRVMADPLQYRCVSTRASRSFAFWRHRNRSAPPSSWRPLVISAELDTVVDNGYSGPWMRRTFPEGRFIEIEGGKHQLLNEIEPMRERVLELVRAELDRPD